MLTYFLERGYWNADSCWHWGGGCQKSPKKCWRTLWVVPLHTYCTIPTSPLFLVCELEKKGPKYGLQKSGCKNRAIIFQKAKRVTLLVAIRILVCADWLANCITILKFYCAISIFSVDWIQSKHELYLKLRKESIHEIKVLFWVDSGQHFINTFGL